MKCPSPPGAVPAANAAAAGGTRLPPARPPARAGAGAGRAPARPVPLRARPRSERGAAARLFVRGAEERRDAGQAAPCSPPPQSSGPEAEEGALGHRRAPLSAASRPAPFCAESRPGGGGTQPGPPALILTPGPGRRAGVPGERPSSARRSAEARRGRAALSAPAPRAPRGGRALGAGPGRASRGDARQGRPRRAGWTDRSAGRAVGPGPVRAPSWGGSEVPGRKEWIWFPRSLVCA